jgi:hypothetical protein
MMVNDLFDWVAELHTYHYDDDARLSSTNNNDIMTSAVAIRQRDDHRLEYVMNQFDIKAMRLSKPSLSWFVIDRTH